MEGNLVWNGPMIRKRRYFNFFKKFFRFKILKNKKIHGIFEKSFDIFRNLSISLSLI